jgi:hypothetical protein
LRLRKLCHYRRQLLRIRLAKHSNEGNTMLPKLFRQFCGNFLPGLLLGKEVSENMNNLRDLRSNLHGAETRKKRAKGADIGTRKQRTAGC